MGAGRWAPGTRWGRASGTQPANRPPTAGRRAHLPGQQQHQPVRGLQLEVLAQLLHAWRTRDEVKDTIRGGGRDRSRCREAWKQEGQERNSRGGGGGSGRPLPTPREEQHPPSGPITSSSLSLSLYLRGGCGGRRLRLEQERAALPGLAAAAKSLRAEACLHGEGQRRRPPVEQVVELVDVLAACLHRIDWRRAGTLETERCVGGRRQAGGRGQA